MWNRRARREAARDAIVVVEERPARTRRFGLGRVTTRARELNARAQAGARRQIDGRRNDAADTLLSLARALRPTASLRAARKRKVLAVAGGSGLALTAALAAGVALGFVLSRQLQKRAERKAQADKPDHTPMPQAMGQDPVTAGLEF